MTVSITQRIELNYLKLFPRKLMEEMKQRVSLQIRIFFDTGDPNLHNKP